MRIIAGRLGGRNFTSPHGNRTHPMSDKVRGALFNALGDIEDLTVLDAFAGSGALSFEAISRGASHVTAIDSDKAAQLTIRENITGLGLQNEIKLIAASANAWLSTTTAAYDLVLLDPPYDNLQMNILSQLADRAVSDGIVVASLPPQAVLELGPSFEKLSQKDYGDATLVFYRKVS